VPTARVAGAEASDFRKLENSPDLGGPGGAPSRNELWENLLLSARTHWQRRPAGMSSTPLPTPTTSIAAGEPLATIVSTVATASNETAYSPAHLAPDEPPTKLRRTGDASPTPSLARVPSRGKPPTTLELSQLLAPLSQRQRAGLHKSASRDSASSTERSSAAQNKPNEAGLKRPRDGSGLPERSFYETEGARLCEGEAEEAQAAMAATASAARREQMRFRDPETRPGYSHDPQHLPNVDWDFDIFTNSTVAQRAAVGDPSPVTNTSMRVDMIDEGNVIEVVVDAPGYARHQVRINGGGNTLKITLYNEDEVARLTSLSSPPRNSRSTSSESTRGLPTITPEVGTRDLDAPPREEVVRLRTPKNYILRERTLRLRKVSRTLRLPCSMDVARTTAKVADGVIRITVPKLVEFREIQVM